MNYEKMLPMKQRMKLYRQRGIQHWYLQYILQVHVRHEIKSAKAIAKQIINKKRDFEVDYILSHFNDPSKI